jgi:hypothetical protein
MKLRSKLVPVLVLCLALLAPGSLAAAECEWECYVSPEEVECRQGVIAFNAAQDCKVVAKCELGGYVRSGDFWIPYYHCNRECEMKWCVWV